MLRKFDDFKKKDKNENLKKFSSKSKAKAPKVDEELEGDDSVKDFKQFPDATGNDGKQSHRAEPANKQSNIRSTKTVVPNAQNFNHQELTNLQAGDHSPDSEGDNLGPVNLAEDGDDGANENVKFFGKVAKFPDKIPASKALDFLEKVKISKKSIWYLMVENQDHELQMVKYNYKSGVNLSEFMDELKKYYLTKLQNDKAPQKVVEAFSKIELVGDDKGNFTIIKNIPKIKIDNKAVITLITEDLIKLLSK